MSLDLSAVKDLLREEPLTGDAVDALLAPAGLRDVPTAYTRLRRIAGDDAGRELLRESLSAILTALADSAVPDGVLVNFERFVQAVPDRVALFASLRDEPRAVEVLFRLFMGSQFLAEILIQNPACLDEITRHKRLAELKSREQYYEEAQAWLHGCPDEAARFDALRRYQRWELLRIGACDSFGLANLKAVTVQLSLLADSLVQCCLDIAARSTGTDPCGFAVLALGKLGGEELNYSSDIDLVFVTSTNAPAFWLMGQRLIRGLVQATPAGFLYRVDMRLRPWGQSGPLVTSAETYLQYLREQASLWEKQALLKAREVAGDLALGEDFIRQVQPLLFAAPPEEIRASVRGMKERIEAGLKQRGREWGEVKSGAGSIRDVEFLTQYLQLLHGGRQPAVRAFKTLDALVRLADFSLLPASEYRILTDGYVFLRKVEHALQLLHYKQAHQLPADRQELNYLAKRLDFPSHEPFLDHYERHCAAIREVYLRYLGHPDDSNSSPLATRQSPLERHLARLQQEYTIAFEKEEIRQHAEMAQRINLEHPVSVEAVPREDGTWRVTIVGYDYLGELSVICGLLFVHGFDLVDGQVFTYAPTGNGEPPAPTHPRRETPSGRENLASDRRQKIVDVFTVRPVRGPASATTWSRYAGELAEFLKRLGAGEQRQAQGELAKRVATALREAPDNRPVLYPVEIEIDNEQSEQHTVLRIRAVDTPGFLYELTNALALNGVDIARVQLRTEEDQALDTLHVTGVSGRKITGEMEQRELRAATVLTKHFTHLLPQSPNPESALLHFREFISQLFTRPNWPDELASLEQTEVLDALAKLLGVSDFLWSDFLRMQHANLFPVVSNIAALESAKSKDQLRSELEQSLADAESREARVERLNAFKDRETFRVDMRHILGRISEFGQFSAELTDIAEVVVEAACRLAIDELQTRYGTPRLEDESRCPYSVCALGKCGGRELGFASDIELMFLYAGNGRTSGPEVVTCTEYYLKFVELVTHAIRSLREGVFEIDLRLRPYGRAGNLAVSLDAFRNYFGPEGAAWPFERQALVKLRPIAGDEQFGRAIIALRDALLYTGEPFDLGAMRGMRERQRQQLVAAGTMNAKFSPGGLVDIEYLVQGLQITHGHAHPELRAPNTVEALTALAAAGILNEEQHQKLLAAYIFERRLIDALRVVRGDARDLTVPAPGSEEFRFLARRLGYEEDASRLQHELTLHTQHVLEISRVLG